MIIFNRPVYKETLIERVKRKEWEKSLKDVSDAEIISFNDDPLNTKQVTEKKEEDNKNATESGVKEQVQPAT